MARKPKCVNPCEICGKEVKECADIQHILPEILWVKGERELLVWHQKCFEDYYDMKFPTKSEWKEGR